MASLCYYSVSFTLCEGRHGYIHMANYEVNQMKC